MHILVRREIFSDVTIGSLYIDGGFFCYTLEDKDRKLEDGGEKVYGETAIPRGTYKLAITYSNRFKQQMPLLMDVSQFEGVRIHPGNTKEDTHGCLLVGTTYSNKRITNSRPAYEKLMVHLNKAIEDGEDVEVEIV
jgi:hypothetical protein